MYNFNLIASYLFIFGWSSLILILGLSVTSIHLLELSRIKYHICT